MANPQIRTLRLQDKEISYTLERKKVKNINLRIRKDGSVYVSASRSVATARIDAFVLSKADFVLNALDRFAELAQKQPPPRQFVSGEIFYLQGRPLTLAVAASSKNNVLADGLHLYLQVKNPEDFADRHAKQRLISQFFDKQCQEIFAAAIAKIYPTFQNLGISFPKLRIRNMKTRWGSCSPAQQAVTLNKQLIGMPQECIEYVVMHEFCHFLQPNHSKHFYALLAQLMPDWQERKKRLEQSPTNQI